MKRVLITGANSYIGESVKEYLLQSPEKYSVVIKDTIGWEPDSKDFKDFDVVFNVAGIAHIKETKDNRHLYYDINRDLVIKIAKTAKEAGVKQFILLSTMSVYGMLVGEIDKNTPTNPINAYGKSKVEADEAIQGLADEDFVFCCLRPPMVYGKGCKGNYQSLRKFALKSLLFPKIDNKRSMIYIGNLCEFVKECIDFERNGLFFPQNEEYTNTSEMVKIIVETHGKKMKLTKVFNWAIRIMPGNTVKKVFGNLVYEKVDTVCKYGLVESIKLTEET
ncbi:MAG: NAD-dependent epimerase/dehydratase family protein [Clostridiales bacterium]|nr:NAD-dependent epimerase/dehydratase family protein [Clostridiales bacterium]